MRRLEIQEIIRRHVPEAKPQAISIATDQIIRLIERERGLKGAKKRKGPN